MELLQPVKPGGDQEPLHFPPADIVDVGVPVLMIAFARIRVLIQRGTVEARHTVRVGGEMPRHPIDDDADIGAVAGIDEAGETIGMTEAGTWREQA